MNSVCFKRFSSTIDFQWFCSGFGGGGRGGRGGGGRGGGGRGGRGGGGRGKLYSKS